MKKFLITFILIIFMTSPVFADDYQDLLLQGIKYYKEKNYLGTIQAMKKIIKVNPGSMLAHYYIAISYAQIGESNEAEAAYNRVIFIDPNSQLAALAELGKERLYPEKTIEDQPLDKKLKNNFQNKLYSENVEEDIKRRKLKYIIDQVNSRREIEANDLEKFEDFTPDKSSRPTSQEISQAYQTLARAGLSANPGSGFNPELMQMNMLAASMGGNMGLQQGSGAMNMLPFLMMMQNQQGNIDPEFMQTMISNMMMPDMTGLYESNKNY